jgi:hypothetical protein
MSNWIAYGKLGTSRKRTERDIGNVQRTRFPRCRGLPRGL